MNGKWHLWAIPGALPKNPHAEVTFWATAFPAQKVGSIPSSNIALINTTILRQTIFAESAA